MGARVLLSRVSVSHVHVHVCERCPAGEKNRCCAVCSYISGVPSPYMHQAGAHILAALSDPLCLVAPSLLLASYTTG